MEIGQKVKVQAYGGEVITRVIVDEIGDTVYLSQEREYDEAKRDGREPNSVGFNKRFIVDYLPIGE